MVFLAVLLALGGTQLFGNPPLAGRWIQSVGSGNKTRLWYLIWILVPTLFVALGYSWLEAHFWLLALPFSTVVLWFSVAGRAHQLGLERFINASRAEDWNEAIEAYRQLLGEELITESDWPALNKAVLERAAYLSFSHIFAVLFWFCVLGPAGALGYRLTCVCAHVQPSQRLGRFIWLLEWPAARLLGLTFAFTGNFLSCFQRWQACVFCTARSSAEIITHYVMGALGVTDDGKQRLLVTRRELLGMDRLLRRSLWFWVGALALVALGGW